MNNTTSIALTGGIATVGIWAEDKKISPKPVVGVAVLAIMMSALSATNEGLADKLTLLVLIAVLWRYVVPIAKKMGYAK